MRERQRQTDRDRQTEDRQTDKRTDILACEWHMIRSIRTRRYVVAHSRQLNTCLFRSEYMPYPV